MAINITKHGSPTKPSRYTRVLLDPERTKKESFDERRKQRLLQVRSQSKELAAQVRRNVNLENKKQLKRIQQIKEKELKNTKRKQQQYKDDEDTTFSEFGEAHRAANIENNFKSISSNRPTCPSIHNARNIFPTDSKNNIKNTKNIDKENLSYNANIQNNDHIYPNVIIENKKPEQIQSTKSCKFFEDPKELQNTQDTIKSHSLKYHQPKKTGDCCFLSVCCCCQPILTCQCNLNANCDCRNKKSKSDLEEAPGKVSSNTSIISSSSETKPISSYASFKERQQQKINKNINTNKLTKTQPVIMEVSSEDSDSSSTSSSCILEDTHKNTNMHFTRIYSRTGNKIHKTPVKYNAKDFQATTDPSSESLDAPIPLPPTLEIPNSRFQYKKPGSIKSQTKSCARFTKISDLLKDKSSEQNISNNLPNSFDKSTQMSPRISDENIAKDVCTRGILVDSNELTQNQFENTTKNKVIENQKRSDNDGNQQQQVPKKGSIFHKAKPKSPRKIIKKNIGLKKQDYPSRISELLGPKSFLSSKTTLPTKDDLTDKVTQYYDYNNRFEKQYQPKTSNIIENDRHHNVGQLNAMENANIERQIQKTKDNELELLRKKSDERCQEAIEREQVRRDYEALQSKLDALTIDKKTGRNISQLQDENIFSDIRLKQLANVRQSKINNAVESILQRPIVITCPEVTTNLPVPPSSNLQNNIKSCHENYENGINVANNNNNADTILSSSDSCGSILLNYVDKRTEEISKDINITNNKEKNYKLKLILNRLNSLRSDLLNELHQSNQNLIVENAFDVINEMNKEHNDIMITNSLPKTNIENKNLEKREKRLKKQEAILEKKLKEFFEMQKSTQTSNVKISTKPSEEINDKSTSSDSIESNKNSTSTVESIKTESRKISTKILNQPIEIIIQVNDKYNKNSKSPLKSPSRTPKRRQKATLIEPITKYKKKLNKISTPKRTNDIIEMKIIDQNCDNNSQTTSSSTAYKNIPNCIETNLHKFLNEHNEQEQNNQNICNENQKNHKERSKKITATTKKPLTPKKLSKPSVNKSTISKKTEPLKSSESPPPQISNLTKQTSQIINPILGHYIQRLLGMSRQSINMLGVSSTTVTTPNSSLINNSVNKSNCIDSNFEKERIGRLQRFIDDNYSFLSDLEESLKADHSSSIINSSEEASQIVLAEIWQKTLKQQKSRDNLKKYDFMNKAVKPILKKTNLNKSTTTSCVESDNSKLEKLGKYTELTESCAQRINELNEMINRVRQEKQKILELTLSSNTTGSTENGTTVYLEFADKQKLQQQQSQSTGGRTYVANDAQSGTKDTAGKVDNITDGNNLAIPPQTIVRVPEIEICENTHLEKNKLTGISRDSGISLSRPVTALGSRDSPDTRRDSKTEDTVIFEPLLKDIPKPNSTNLFPCKSEITVTTITDKLSKKPNKPPVALSRFSPQLIEEIPHELSTILEIDTPGTSRLNPITKHLSTDENIEIQVENNDNELLQPLIDNEYQGLEDDIEMDFKKFPTFEEYAKKHNLDLSNFDPELNTHMHNEYQKLLELTQSLKEIEYNDYPSPLHYKNAKKELQELISISDLCDNGSPIDLINSNESLHGIKSTIQNFPTAKEYFQKIGSSFTPDNFTISTNDLKTSTDDKCILISPCESLPDVNAELKRRNVIQHSFVNPYKNGSDKDGTSEDLNSISSNSKSGKKILKQNKEKCPMSGLEQFTSTTTATTLTTGKTEEIEKDLEKMGMKWAQVMLQKTHSSQALSSSTASSFLFEKHLKPSFRRDKEIKSSTRYDMDKEIDDSSDNLTNTESDGGKPINLRKFLSQELQKHANSSTSSSTVIDDSIVNIFLRSLLGSVTPPSSGKQTTDRKQKTSTPVQTLSKSQSSSIKTSSKNTSSDTTKLFSGESRLSSVRFSQSDNEKSNNYNSKINTDNNYQKTDSIKKKSS